MKKNFLKLAALTAITLTGSLNAHAFSNEELNATANNLGLSIPGACVWLEMKAATPLKFANAISTRAFNVDFFENHQANSDEIQKTFTAIISAGNSYGKSQNIKNFVLKQVKYLQYATRTLSVGCGDVLGQELNKISQAVATASQKADARVKQIEATQARSGKALSRKGAIQFERARYTASQGTPNDYLEVIQLATDTAAEAARIHEALQN